MCASGLVALVACASAAVPATAPTPTPATKCERAPAHASPSDEHYRISVSGEPDLFLPGELYTGISENIANFNSHTYIFERCVLNIYTG